MTETTMLSQAGSLAARAAISVNRVISDDSSKSGNLDKLGMNLVFPSDLANDPNQTEIENGMIHWVTFTTFSKENGTLSSLVKSIAGFGQREQNINEFSSSRREAEGEISEETIQAEEELNKIRNTKTLLGDLQNDSALNTETSSDARLGRAETRSGDTLSIYLPGNLTFEDSMSYEEASFAALKGLSNTSAFRSLSSLNKLRKLGGMADIAAALVGQDSLNTGQALSAALGVVVNPRKEQLFQGTSFRSFDFNFNLIPRSRDEAETAANIIKLFRFHAYPELSKNGAFFQFPSEFQIEFKSVDLSNPRQQKAIPNPSLPKLKRCFLEKVSTNYTPDEVYHSFKDGKPVRLELSLSFKEAQYITRNDIQGGY